MHGGNRPLRRSESRGSMPRLFIMLFSLFWQQISDHSLMARRRIFPWLWCFQTVSFYCILHGKHAIIIRRFI
nr:MAG TPA: hypothetical protein [Caudoviricetes sp.]